MDYQPLVFKYAQMATLCYTTKRAIANDSRSQTLQSTQHSRKIQDPYLWANHADVTIDNFSRNVPKCCGPSVTTTTAFCTVDLVTSGGR
jgi:hypothetical protein